MLKAFFNQLKYLANDKDGLFHKHFEKRIGNRADPELEAELKETILLMPSVMSRIVVLWAQLEKNSRIKEVGSYFITYMHNPQDFIPEDEATGLFGYLDDAYLVCLVYDLLTEELAHSQKPLLKEDKLLREKLLGVKGKIKSVIPVEATKIQQMIGEILTGEDVVFTSLFVESKK